MGRHARSYRWLSVMAAATAIMVLEIRASGPPDFLPDGVFKGSTLAGWHAVGQADWKAVNGEIVGTPKPGGPGGWLVMDKSFQDLQFFANFKCTGDCATGLLFRAQKTPEGGLKGVFVSLKEDDLVSYNVVLDGQGREISRERLAAPAGRGGGAGRGAAPAVAPGAAPGAAGRGTDPSAGGPGAGAPPAAGRGAPPAAAAGGGGGRGRFRTGDWNAVQVVLAVSPPFRPTINGAAMILGGTLDETTEKGYGPVALYVGGSGEARFKDVSWKDLNAVVEPKEEVSSRFTRQRLSELYYGWCAAAADINHDGVLDVVSGPFYYLGPAFTERRLYRAGRVYNPSLEYAPDMINFSHDFTGDGWPDILSSTMGGTRAMDLYVNPKGEPRRWDKHPVLPDPITELVLMKDIDADGRQDIVFGTATGYAYASPDPANPTARWPVHTVSRRGRANIHGLGVGDVNGDKRLDVVGPSGWYEQPAKSSSPQDWTFHPASFGSGGAEIGVYDVNGDGLPDVVTSLQAHGWGLAWFEQKRAQGGTVSFVQHPIAGDYSTTNAGNVVFSEPHGARFGDMNGDGTLDFIVGKRYWSHLENYNGPDPYGAAVLYVYKTVRNKNAPGGAEFVPELIHNRSGVGSHLEVVDLNKDGALDIATSTAYGTFVFLAAKPAPRK
jgi:hypothetical protein